MAPSTKQLCRITTPETAATLRAVLLAPDPLEYLETRGLCPRTVLWANRSYLPQETTAIKLEAANELLGLYGVEYFGEVDIHDGPRWSSAMRARLTRQHSAIAAIETCFLSLLGETWPKPGSIDTFLSDSQNTPKREVTK